MEQIKPIETFYNGYRFRSRLEARWAVFFDTAGIEYEYEPEGFDCGDGVYYLPDFYLPENDVWVEIKGKALTEEERLKIEKFADAKCDITKTGTRFRLLEGQIPATFDWMPPGIVPSEYMGDIELQKKMLIGIPCFIYWHKNEIKKAFGQEPDTGALIGGIWTHPNWQSDPRIVQKALLKARQARFEHGETP